MAKKEELVSKWRPHSPSLYVIPDIHGNLDLLDQCLKRILPLRKKDKIVFLGDYIDRHIDSHFVLDRVIELKQKYGDRVICLMGNHELLLLEGLGFLPSSKSKAESYFNCWASQGGLQTIAGYLQRRGSSEDLLHFINNANAVKRLIPSHHINFLKSLLPYYEEDNFVFVHGGCHPDRSPAEYSMDVLCWDRSLINLVKKALQEGQNLPWKKCLVVGHTTVPTPIVKDNFLALDIGSPKKLLFIEAHSREAFIAYPDRDRLLKYELEETKVVRKAGLIKRVS